MKRRRLSRNEKQEKHLVLLRPPKEANLKEKIFPPKKALYGLPDASRVWYLRIHGELLKHGATKCKYDKDVFTWKSEETIQGIFAALVEDFLFAGIDSFVANAIASPRSTFKVSTESKDCFTYIGINTHSFCFSIELDLIKSYK